MSQNIADLHEISETLFAGAMAALSSSSSFNSMSDCTLLEDSDDKVRAEKDLDYNSAPLRKELQRIVDRMEKSNYTVKLTVKPVTPGSAVFVCELEWDGVNAKDPIASLPLSNVLRSSQSSSKNLAKAFVALELLSLLPDYQTKLQDWKKLYHDKDAPHGPVHLLNMIVAKHNDKYQYESKLIGSGSDRHFQAKFTFPDPEVDPPHGRKTVCINYAYYPDHRYCYNKLAALALERGSFYTDELATCYQKIRKNIIFIRGSIFPHPEDMMVELKGSSDPSTPMTTKAVLNRAGDYGKVICGFLNSCGGSLYVGIADNPAVIHGIACKMADLDKFKRRVIETITSKLKPYSPRLVRFEFHQVKGYDDDSCCWVIEVRVSQSDVLAFYNETAHERDNGILRRMDDSEVDRRKANDEDAKQERKQLDKETTQQ